MKYFTITPTLDIACEWKKTSTAFKHTATIVRNGSEHGTSVKICYQNRTWERYEFESVLEKLLATAKDLTNIEKTLFQEKITKQFRNDDVKETSSMFGTIAMVAQMGALLAGDTQKQKNDWKTQMIKAGLGNQGLIMPKNWDTLDEDVKEEKLNKIIEELKK